MRNFFAASVLFAASLTLAQAGTIVSVTSGTALNSQAGYFGQSFTTPSGGPWNTITFDFFSNSPATTPTAVGTAFILTQSYAGTPQALSSSTAGFLASSTSVSGGKYVFANTLTLAANTTYFIYENGQFAINSVSGSTSGGGLYFASSNTTNFGTTSGSANYNLSGTATPEPGMFSAVGLGLAGFSGFLAQVRRRKPASVTTNN